MSAEPSILSPEFTAYDKVLPFVPWHGPICDSIGFSQHYGECWNDATQMLLLYTDGIREQFQRILFEYAINEPLIKMTIRDLVPADKVEKLTRYMHNYMQLMQRRFKRHYIGHILGPRMGSGTGRNALPCAAYGKYTTQTIAGRPTPNIEGMSRSTYVATYTSGYAREILYLIGRIYGLFSLAQPQELFTSRGIFSYFRDRRVRGALVTTTGHTFCFYECGGTEYYYDNEHGVIRFPWHKFFDARQYPLVERDFNESNRFVIVNLSIDGRVRTWPAIKILTTLYFFDGARIRIPMSTAEQTIHGRRYRVTHYQPINEIVALH